MRAWLHTWRVYLALAPLVLTVGLGGSVWYAVEEHGRPRVVDVPKGQVAEYRGIEFQLSGVAVEPPPEGVEPPPDAVRVVAVFRARFDDPRRAAAAQCVSYVENGEGLRWQSPVRTIRPVRNDYTCDGRFFDDAGDLARAQPGTWYEFYYDYWVREERATELRPVLTFQSSTTLAPYQDELRFAG